MISRFQAFAFNIPTCTATPSSAAELLASPTTQRALSVVESVAIAQDAFARRANKNINTDAKGAAATSAAHLRVAALRAALAAASEEAASTGALGPAAWRRCCVVFSSLSALWAHSREADAEADAEVHDLFKSRTKAPTALETLEGDDEATEEEAYKRAFGGAVQVQSSSTIA